MNKSLSNNMCRICFDITSESYCNCKGSIKYIHKSCLENWIYSRNNSNMWNCEICKSEYNTNNNNHYIISFLLFLLIIYINIY